jgi:copper chaperone CopZ
MATQVLKVGGMSCGGCAKHVDKALRAVDGVSAVSVDVAQGTATVEGSAFPEALAAGITEAGYQALGPA